jgi:hypothetical protein
MSQATATLIGAGVVVVSNLLTAAYIYGQLTQKVKNLEQRVDRLEARPMRAHHGD